MAKTSAGDFKTIMSDLKAKDFRPVYYLCGDEPYYIDCIREYIEDNVLTEDEKAYNQDVYYGADIKLEKALMSARQYPVMSAHRVVIVKEAHNLKNMDALVQYLKKPAKQNILVFASMKPADKRLKFISELDKAGCVFFESKVLRENMLPSFITGWFKDEGFSIEPQAAQMMADNIGSDLNKIVNEAKKLAVSLPKGTANINGEMVNRYVSVSKQFNVFEFKTALVNKNITKVNRIANFFASNAKQNPLIPILAVLYGYFSNLFIYKYMDEGERRNDGLVSKTLGISPYMVSEYATGARNYNARQVMNILTYIMKADGSVKGLGNNSKSEGDILIELVSYIMNA